MLNKHRLRLNIEHAHEMETLIVVLLGHVQYLN